MGTVRTLLALSVVLAHACAADDASHLVGGVAAVQMFYAISGFLISYVLLEARTYASTAAFYANRYLRLYPVYVVVAAFTLLLTYRPYGGVFAQLPASAAALVSVANLTLVGQDWLMFLGVRGGELMPVAQFDASQPPLRVLLLVPQAWTLGLELTFYVLAPFVLRHRGRLLFLLLASLAVRVGLWARGFDFDPWTYRFFPNELALFLVGALAHQVGLPLVRRWTPATQARAAAAVTGVTVFAVWLFPHVPGAVGTKHLALLAGFVLSLPLLFVFQSAHAWDRAVGELSYPLYIGHMLLLWMADHWLAVMGWDAITKTPLAIAAKVVGCFAFAWLLYRVVAVPVENLRRRIKRRTASGAQAAVAPASAP